MTPKEFFTRLIAIVSVLMTISILALGGGYALGNKYPLPGFAAANGKCDPETVQRVANLENDVDRIIGHLQEQGHQIQRRDRRRGIGGIGVGVVAPMPVGGAANATEAETSK